MQYRRKVFGITSILALAAAAANAMADEVTLTANCAIVGSLSPEPIGDRDGHAIGTEQDLCLDQTGPFAGGVESSHAVWEWNGPTATLLSHAGVVRKPGAMAAVQLTEGKIELTMTNGKVTGATASGKGRWPIATGSAAAYSGKTFTWTSKTVGFNQFSVEVRAQ
jgi:hypothetical protein